MKKTVVILIIALIYSAASFAAPAENNPKITNPSDDCKNTTGSIIAGLQEGGEFPGKWKVKKIECRVGSKAFFQIDLKKPGKPDLTLVAVPLKGSQPLLASTKFFTIGFQTKTKNRNTNPEVEAATRALAGIIKKHESAVLVSNFKKHCSKPFIPAKISNSISPSNPRGFLNEYDGRITKAFNVAKTIPPHGFWSSVYVSCHIVFCPVVLLTLSILLAAYVKILSRKSINPG